MPRMRILRWIVQPVVVADDGDELTEIEVQPIAIPNTAWETFITTGWHQAVDELRRQVEGVTEDA